MKKCMALIIICLLQFLLQKALSCTCVNIQNVPTFYLSSNKLCSDGSTYHGRPHYYTDDKDASLFYNNVNGTWQVGASLGTSHYYVISYDNVSLPQHATSWDIKSPSSSNFLTNTNISVKCYPFDSFNSLWLMFMFPCVVVVGFVVYTIRMKARQGKLCKKQTDQSNNPRRSSRLFRCCCHQEVGVATSTSTSVTTQPSTETRHGQERDARTRRNRRGGQERQETGRTWSSSDLPGHSSVRPDNGGSEGCAGDRPVLVPEGTDATGPLPYPAARGRHRGMSPPPSYSSIWTSRRGGEHSPPRRGGHSSPPPPTYAVAMTLSQYY